MHSYNYAEILFVKLENVFLILRRSKYTYSYILWMIWLNLDLLLPLVQKGEQEQKKKICCYYYTTFIGVRHLIHSFGQETYSEINRLQVEILPKVLVFFNTCDSFVQEVHSLLMEKKSMTVYHILVHSLLMSMGWRICGALVQSGCYQHRYEWVEGSMVL